MTGGAASGGPAWRDYVAIARPDHWVKHLFIAPGIVVALLLRGGPDASVLWRTVLSGLVSAALTASANYVLNEWLDRRQDAFHPVKSARPAAAGRISRPLVAAEYVALLILGLGIAATISKPFLMTSVLLVVSGLVYNVPPLRTKERVYLDVISESFNNPLRLVLGWTMVDSASLPPVSLLFAFWLGGAFLMATKRLAEYRAVSHEAGSEALHRYRRSFRFYSQTSLLLSTFTYALSCSFFLAIFLVKYRIEYLLSVPLLTALFVEYLRLGLSDESPVQAPERLHRQRRLTLLGLALLAALAALTWIDVPPLARLMVPHYIEFDGR